MKASHPNNAVSRNPWETVLFAGINAGLEQGAFGRRPHEPGSMTTEHGSCVEYSFEFSGMELQAKVASHYDGAELRLIVYRPSSGRRTLTCPYLGAQLHHGFDLIARGEVEREKGFYLRGEVLPNKSAFATTRSMHHALRMVSVELDNFYVVPAANTGRLQKHAN